MLGTILINTILMILGGLIVMTVGTRTTEGTDMVFVLLGVALRSRWC
jgi:hypothetical protein